MNSYSKQSQANLDSCHWHLQVIFIDALQVMDHSILCGYRSQDEQLALFIEEQTKVRLGEHNCTPSRAVDAIPYPVDWDDLRRVTLFAGIVLGIAHKRGIKIRWGGDWDQDTQVKDNKFNDLVHFELKE